MQLVKSIQNQCVLWVTTLVLLPGCGMFNFQPKAEVFGGLVGTDIVDLRLTVGLKEFAPGDCVAIRLETLGVTGKSLIIRDTTKFSWSGTRSSDKFYSDEDCSVAVVASDLQVQAGKSEKTLYFRTSIIGNIQLQATFDVLKKVMGLVVKSLPRRLDIQASSTTTLPAGYCSSPYSVRLLDNNSNAVSVARYELQLLQGRGIMYVDNLCTIPVTNNSVFIENDDKFVFYLKKNVVSSVFEPVTFGSTDPNVIGESTSFFFESVPFRVQISGGPAVPGPLVLGRCDAPVFYIELVDVEGRLVRPKANTTVNLAFNRGVGTYRRNTCAGAVVASLLFDTATSQIPVGITAGSRGKIQLSASSAGLQSALSAEFDVLAVPLRVSLTGPSPIVAGSIAGPYTVTLLDGLDAPIANSGGGKVINIGGNLPTVATLCSDASCGTPITQIVISNSAASALFYVRPNANLENATYSLQALPTDTSLAFAQMDVSIARRVPAKLRLSGGPSNGKVNLDECDPNPFTIELLDAANQPVTVPTGQTINVILATTPVNAGTFYTTCGGTAASNILFPASSQSKNFSFKATSTGSITINARDLMGSFANVTLTVSVVAEPRGLRVSGPTSVKAGVPAGPFRAYTVDALGNEVTTIAPVIVDLELDAAANASFCSSSACTNRITGVTIPLGASSANFHYLSDSDNDINDSRIGVRSLLGNDQILVDIDRNPLEPDPTYTIRANTNFAPLSGGEVLASAIINGKLLVGGYQLQGANKRMVLAQYKWNPSAPTEMGELDTSFSSDGKAEFSLGSDSWISAIANKNGKIFVAGVTKTGAGDTDILVFQVNSNGLVDSTYRGGISALVLPGDQYATAIAMAPDGYPYVAGYAAPDAPTADDTSDFMLVGFDDNGAVAGPFRYDFSAQAEMAHAAAVVSIGGEERIVLGGTQQAISAGLSDFAFLRAAGRFNNSLSVGAIDLSFGSSGQSLVNTGSATEELRTLSVQSTGRIVAAGYNIGLTSVTTGVMVALTSSGTLDTTFAGSGKLTIDLAGSQEKIHSSALNPLTNEIYLAGSMDAGFAVLRYAANGSGSVIRTYGSAGEVGKRIVLEPGTNKPVVFGQSSGNFKGMRFLR